MVESRIGNRNSSARIVLLSLIVTLIMIAPALSPQFLFLPAQASGQSFQPPSNPYGIEIGYGPSSLMPLSEGVPIFAYDDQLWLLATNTSLNAYLEYTVNGNNYYTALVYVQQNAITQVFTFGLVTADNWLLYIEPVGESTFTIPINDISPLSVPTVKGNSSAYFSNNALAINFSYYGPQAYNAQVCLPKSSTSGPSAAEVAIPPDFGSGLVQISEGPNSTSGAQIVTFGSLSRATIFSFETLYTYTYTTANGTGLVSSQIETSKSSPVLLTMDGTINDPVSTFVSQRPGRYVLRAIFDNGANVSAISETTLLSTSSGQDWLWLGGCYPSVESGTVFTSRVTLPPSPAPQSLYLMFDTEGVESFQSFNLNYSVGSVKFSALPQSAPLSGVQITPQSDGEIQAFEFTNDTMYLISPSFPMNVNFNASFEGITFAKYQVSIPSSDSVLRVTIPLSEIIVNATNNGKAFSGINISLAVTEILTSGGSIVPKRTISLSTLTSTNGIATFYVPAGNYSVTASYTNLNITKSGVITQAGQSDLVKFAFSVSGANGTTPPDYLTPLVVILILGIVGNILVWVWGIRRRRRSGYL